MGQKQQWFEISEFGLLLLILGVWLWEVIRGRSFSVTTVLLLGTLTLNFFNRLAQRNYQDRRMIKMMRHLEAKLQTEQQRLSSQIHEFKRQRNVTLANIHTDEDLNAYLGSFDASLTAVVRYLNQENIDTKDLVLRLESLETRVNSLDRLENSLSSPSKGQPELELEAIADPWGWHPDVPNKNPSLQWRVSSTFAAHHDAVTSLSFSQAAEHLVSGSRDAYLKLWQVAGAQCLTEAHVHGQSITCFPALSAAIEQHDSLRIATCGDEAEIKIWSLDLTLVKPQFVQQQTLVGHEAPVSVLAIAAPDVILTGSQNQSMGLWHLSADPNNYQTFSLEEPIRTIACAPQSKVFMTLEQSGVLQFWRIQGHHSLGRLTHDSSDLITVIAIHQDGTLFATGGEQGIIYLWHLDLNHLEALPASVPCFSFQAHGQAITQLIFDGTHGNLISGSIDGELKIWPLGHSEPSSVLYLNDRTQEAATTLTALALSPDGHHLAAGSVDGLIQLWHRG